MNRMLGIAYVDVRLWGNSRKAIVYVYCYFNALYPEDIFTKARIKVVIFRSNFNKRNKLDSKKQNYNF